MEEIKEEEQLIKKLLKVLRPNLLLPVWTTVICSGPLLNLLLDYPHIRNLTAAVIATVVSVVCLVFIWLWYIKDKRIFSKLKKELPIVVHYLYAQDEISLEKVAELEVIVFTKSLKEVLKNIRLIMDNSNR